MKKSIPVVSAACLLLSLAPPAPAQEQAAGGPPRVLNIIREVVKPGKGAAHEKIEVGWPRAFAKAKWSVHYLAMTTVTGPNEAWFIEGYDSFASWEKGRNEMDKNDTLRMETNQLADKDGELLSGINMMAAIFREDLSYRANVNVAQMRYFSVTTVRVRPGHMNDFVEARRIINAAREKANVDDHQAVFQVISGAPSATYLIFSPMKSLKRMDDFPQIYGQAYRDALGDDGRKKLAELAGSGTLFSETNVFAFSPKMSYASKEMAAADPDFWTPKPKAAKAAPAAKKEGEKPKQ